MAQPKRHKIRQIEAAQDDAESENRTDQYVAPNQRIAETSREHPAPRNDAPGPTPPDKRLERQIDHPEEQGPEQHVLNATEEVNRFVFRGYVMSRKQPVQKEDSQQKCCETKRAPAIAATEFHVAQCKQRTPKHHDDED